jgi:hypothetical protein
VWISITGSLGREGCRVSGGGWVWTVAGADKALTLSTAQRAQKARAGASE